MPGALANYFGRTVNAPVPQGMFPGTTTAGMPGFQPPPGMGQPIPRPMPGAPGMGGGVNAQPGMFDDGQPQMFGPGGGGPGMLRPNPGYGNLGPFTNPTLQPMAGRMQGMLGQMSPRPMPNIPQDDAGYQQFLARLYGGNIPPAQQPAMGRPQGTSPGGRPAGPGGAGRPGTATQINPQTPAPTRTSLPGKSGTPGPYAPNGAGKPVRNVR